MKEGIDMEDKDFWLAIERGLEEELEACRNCAYNDCGSCSCYERHSIECPYSEEEDGD